MKLERLIGIISVLLQRDTVTAPYLAERFEVSRRTINRDIEALCRAGIPIVTRQGPGGGISIMDNYKLSHTLLTAPEMQDILAGLQSLDSVSGTCHYRQLMEKLCPSQLISPGQTVLIDLSAWHKGTLAPKIQLIRQAIDEPCELSFRYFSQKGETRRAIQPYFLIFHWSDWYVWGFCKLRGDYRMFKLNRMDALETGEGFVRLPDVRPDLGEERIFPSLIHVKALFHPECKYRLVEEYGMAYYTEQPDGKLLMEWEHTDRENLIMWLMTFRDKAELLEPRELRTELRNALHRAWEQYKGDDGP